MTGMISSQVPDNRDGGAMHRLNFLEEEPWDEVHADLRMLRRWFGHPLGTDMLGASLTELLPGSPGGRLHMHYGMEEMFFVLSGTPTLRTPEGEEQLGPERSSTSPKGRTGCTRSRIQRTRRCACWASPANVSLTWSPTPNKASPGWLRAIQSAECRGRRRRNHRPLRSASRRVIHPRRGTFLNTRQGHAGAPR
jgi:mannose-6-phosphate isomerase-like protein (cupin superfamily)